MLLHTSKLKCSKSDILRGIKIPVNMSTDLAEDIGIHVGDGFMNIYKRPTGKAYQLGYSGDKRYDKDYFAKVLLPLKSRLYNLHGNVHEVDNTNELRVRFNSLLVIEFYHKLFQIPLGNKSKIVRIPSKILQKRDYYLAFLRGLSATDFCVKIKHRKKVKPYPIIYAGFASRLLVHDIMKILDKEHMKYYYCARKRNRLGKTHFVYEIYISGRNNLSRWIELIGFNHPKILKRLDLIL